MSATTMGNAFFASRPLILKILATALAFFGSFNLARSPSAGAELFGDFFQYFIVWLFDDEHE